VSSLCFIYPFNSLKRTFFSDPNEQAYFWLPDSELTSTTEMLDTPLTSRMYIDRGELVRVRVESDEFYDDEPGPPKAAEGVVVQRPLRRSPFQVIVRVLWFLSDA